MKQFTRLPTSPPRLRQLGFTLVETMIIMAIIATLFGVSSVLLSRLIPRANLVSTTEVLTAELRSQQLKAMTGEKNSAGEVDTYGIYLQTDRYTLFEGDSFDPDSPGNLVTSLTNYIRLSTTLPDQVVIFTRGRGEILNSTGNNHTITISDTLTGDTRLITLNPYGIPE